MTSLTFTAYGTSKRSISIISVSLSISAFGRKDFTRQRFHIASGWPIKPQVSEVWEFSDLDLSPADCRIYMVLLRKDIFSKDLAKQFKDLFLEPCWQLASSSTIPLLSSDDNSFGSIYFCNPCALRWLLVLHQLHT